MMNCTIKSESKIVVRYSILLEDDEGLGLRKCLERALEGSVPEFEEEQRRGTSPMRRAMCEQVLLAPGDDEPQEPEAVVNFWGRPDFTDEVKLPTLPDPVNGNDAEWAATVERMNETRRLKQEAVNARYKRKLKKPKEERTAADKARISAKVQAMNAARQRRKAEREAAASPPPPAPEAEIPDDDDEKREKPVKVRKAAGPVGTTEREKLALRVVAMRNDDFSMADTAKFFGVTHSELQALCAEGRQLHRDQFPK